MYMCVCVSPSSVFGFYFDYDNIVNNRSSNPFTFLRCGKESVIVDFSFLFLVRFTGL